MTEIRRPITPDEAPHLARFGALLATRRRESGLTQKLLASSAGFGCPYLQRLEYGQRRPRASTIRRLAEAMADECPSLPPAAVLTMEMIKAVGPALAPESEYRERIERHRDRKARRRAREIEHRSEVVATALHLVKPMAETIAKAEVERRRQVDATRWWASRAQWGHFEVPDVEAPPGPGAVLMRQVEQEMRGKGLWLDGPDEPIVMPFLTPPPKDDASSGEPRPEDDEPVIVGIPCVVWGCNRLVRPDLGGVCPRHWPG